MPSGDTWLLVRFETERLRTYYGRHGVTLRCKLDEAGKPWTRQTPDGPVEMAPLFEGVLRDHVSVLVVGRDNGQAEHDRLRDHAYALNRETLV